MNRTDAWKAAYQAADAGRYELDAESEVRAGYKIYRSDKNPMSRICDLGNRLEVVTAEGTSINVWIEASDEARDVPPTAPDAPKQGAALTKVLETLIRDKGWKYKTDTELKAAFDRRWKSHNNMLITVDEFIEEAGEHYHDKEALRATYEALVKLVESGKLRPTEVCGYASLGWCLKNSSAIVAYESADRKWVVNNCDTEITEDRAKIAVNREWGFEASCVQIIGTPYYDATDWQFIRFDCAHMTWLWENGNLHQVIV